MGRLKRTVWVADFETTTDPDDCRVWGWGACEIYTADTVADVDLGHTLEEFFDTFRRIDAAVYFHNLKFDGSFIMDRLLRMGFTHTFYKPRRGQFSTMISHMASFYSITVMWDNGKKTEFRDSLKKLPMSVANVAKAFKLPETKGSIDYNAPRPIGYRMTPDEANYIARDVLIVSLALRQQFSEGMKKLTVGSDALTEFKELFGTKLFSNMFPILPAMIDDDIRTAYRGGFTYADTRYKGRVIGSGRVYDVNSLYPAVMYDEILPYGEPELFEGSPPEPTTAYPLHIVSITFTAKLKPGHIPCIQVKGSSMFSQTEYQRNIKDPTTLMATNVDIALWEDHYDLDILAYNGGYSFHGEQGMFKDFIDKWMEVKKNSDGGLRAIAKLMLNSLYGKFATNPNITGKYPVMENDVIKLVLGPEETRDPVYTAMGVFITAYARDKTVRAAQEHYEVFAYADTDSLHLLIQDDPPTLDVDPQKLGAWKFEYQFEEALFVRAKAYIERLTDGTHVTHIAGLPDKISDQLTIKDFKDGKKFHGKLIPKRVRGGIILEETDYTLNF
jgi:hypothetical protein